MHRANRRFDAGTAAFERVFPRARARAFPELENPYVCPLCRKPFAREGLAGGTLTFEDAPPRSYGRHFSIPRNQNDPKAVDRFNAILDGKDPAAWANLSLTLKWDQVKRRRADVAWLKSAYMVAFATGGYMYAFAAGAEDRAASVGPVRR
jgi:hypothetical protein